MSKTLHIFNVDNAIDIITNSSSELFILNGLNIEMVNGMIESVYLDYRTEYEEVVTLKNATADQIDTYLSCIAEPFNWNEERRVDDLSDEEKLKHEIEKDEKKAAKYGMTPEEFFVDWEETNNPKNKWRWTKISEAGLRKAAEQLDPNETIFMLFSIDENPNWDYQEKLMDIGQRYHLG